MRRKLIFAAALVSAVGCMAGFTTREQWADIGLYTWFNVYDKESNCKLNYYVIPETEQACMSDPNYGMNLVFASAVKQPPLYEGDIVIPPAVTHEDVTYAVTEVNSFYDSAVTSVTVPEGVTRVEGFVNCARLSSVSLPQSVTEIAGFIGCPALRYIECVSPVPLAIGKDAFRDIDRSKCTVVVPEGSVETYRADPEWGQFRIVGSGSGVGEVSDAGGLPVEVEAVAGGIRVAGGTPAAVRVIGIDGTVAAALTVCGGQTVALPAGVYVVAAGGRASKVAVR